MRRMTVSPGAKAAARSATAIGSVAFGLCLMGFSSRVAPLPLPEAILIFAGFAVLVFGSVVLADGEGVQVLWLLLLIGWLLSLLHVFASTDWAWAESIKRLPEPFSAWAVFAFPLTVITATILYRRQKRYVTPAIVLACGGLWLALLAMSFYLAGLALDVGRNPRHHPVFVVLVGLLLAPFPVGSSLLAILRLRRSDDRAREATREGPMI